MATRALVLGGGGTVGIAWETGLLNGLKNAGIDASNADLIVGTSAGSVVGSQLALGVPLETLLAGQMASPEQTQDPPLAFDVDQYMQISARFASNVEMTPELLVEIGALALAARTEDEAAYLTRFATMQDLPWPPRRLLITAVDAASGEFVAWDSSGTASLHQAVASSCAVPGIFPPVTVAERRYMDGGMRSTTNANLVHGYDSVLIIAPISSQREGMGPVAQLQMEHEVAQLRAAGSQVEVIVPDAEAVTVFGPNLMDVQRRVAAAHTGLRQGASAAETVRAVWQQV